MSDDMPTIPVECRHCNSDKLRAFFGIGLASDESFDFKEKYGESAILIECSECDEPLFGIPVKNKQIHELLKLERDFLRKGKL